MPIGAHFGDQDLIVASLPATTIISQGEAVAWPALLAVWFIMGIGYSAGLTPSGRLLRRSSHQQDRPALFAAQFALSHACWLVTYPLAGWLGASVGMSSAILALGILAALGSLPPYCYGRRTIRKCLSMSMAIFRRIIRTCEVHLRPAMALGTSIRG